jgi:hypothetical protein
MLKIHCLQRINSTYIAVKKEMLFHDMHKNYTNADLIKILMVYRSTFFKWLKDIKIQWINVLKLQKRGSKMGSGRILSTKEESMIQEIILPRRIIIRLF